MNDWIQKCLRLGVHAQVVCIAGQRVGTRCHLLVPHHRSRTESYQELAWMIVEAVGTYMSFALVEVAPCTFAYLKVCPELPASQKHCQTTSLRSL
ncbi:unnamed protein product [Amoebophrya sp. A25]|nr:unnamed protein product [Amoebophrya sp. A25]|eukprot:GSA25T00007733001.1